MTEFWIQKCAVLMLCVLLCAPAACTDSEKVAVVDAARLFQESDPGKAGFAHLQNIESAVQKQLQSAQQMMEKSPKDAAMRERFQKIFLGYQQMVNAEQQKVIEQVNNAMQHALDEYRTSNGYAVIMATDTVLSHAPEADVTDAILAEMNKVTVTFAEVKLDDLNAASEKQAQPAESDQKKQEQPTKGTSDQSAKPSAEPADAQNSAKNPAQDVLPEKAPANK